MHEHPSLGDSQLILRRLQPSSWWGGQLRARPQPAITPTGLGSGLHQLVLQGRSAFYYRTTRIIAHLRS